MEWYESLLDDQAAAASHYGTHARLLAGPGTGKTLVLTRRILYLVEERGIQPDQILAITFTRAAAYELKQRVENVLGEDNMPRISTLHSFALRQLLLNSRKLMELPSPLRVADDWEERHIILEDLKMLLELDRIDDAREKLNQLASDWESLAAEQGTFTPDPRFIGAWNSHRSIFGYTLRSELVYQLKRAMEQIEDFEIDTQTGHFLVDEYQDLNRCDLAVVKSVTNLGHELFVAGDDDQSIYGFRKAHPEGIRQFLEDYPGAVNLPINVCKRCDKNILDLGEFVADLDIQRMKKSTRAEDGRPPGEVALLLFSNQSSEARGIAMLCRSLIDVDGYQPSDILILSRVNTRRAYSSVLESAFASENVPFAGDIASNSPLDENPGRIILSFLRLLRNQSDHLAWRSLLMLRQNRIGKITIQSLIDKSISSGTSFAEMLFQIRENPDSITRYGNILADETSRIISFTSELSEQIALEDLDIDLFRELLDRIENFSCNHGEGLNAQEYLSRLFEESEASSLVDFLPYIESSNENIEQELDSSRVNMLTMHKAKGLSAKAVIVMAVEDETIPGRQENEPGLGDERRLLFVSLTRAKHNLYITYCNRRSGRQRHLGRNSGNPRRTLTRFLRDAPIHPQDGKDFIHRKASSK